MRITDNNIYLVNAVGQISQKRDVDIIEDEHDESIVTFTSV